MTCSSVQRTHVTTIPMTQSQQGRMKEIADNKPGFIRAMWCGCQECEDAIKEDFGVTSRCMPFKQVEAVRYVRILRQAGNEDGILGQGILIESSCEVAISEADYEYPF